MDQGRSDVADQRQVRSSQADDMRRAEPQSILGTETTYIRAQESWLYLAVLVNLFSGQVVDCSMGCRFGTDPVLDALVVALWRRRPEQPVTVHSDQGSQFTGGAWQDFLCDHKLTSSMSRRGNCHDNVVAENFFQLLKRKRIRRKIYLTRDAARADVSTASRCCTTQIGANPPLELLRR